MAACAHVAVRVLPSSTCTSSRVLEGGLRARRTESDRAKSGQSHSPDCHVELHNRDVGFYETTLKRRICVGLDRQGGLTWRWQGSLCRRTC